MSDERETLLSVENLVSAYRAEGGSVRAVDDVSLVVHKGERLGLVGESGSGKTTIALSILRLLGEAGEVEGGRILFRGRDLLKLSEREMCSLRGQSISMIFQEPMTALNPVYTIGSQVMEALRIHRRVSRREAKQAALQMLERVGMPPPDRRFEAWPHQLSGGLRQRAVIAMALLCQPQVLLADEPTTALDVTLQAQILELLVQLQEQTAIVLVTHDLALLASFVERVVVLYAGQVVEEASVSDLFARPAHPYSRALLDALPAGPIAGAGGRLATIPGRVPDLRSLPPGCRFQDRCPFVDQKCRSDVPALVATKPNHRVRCFHPLGIAS